MPNILRNSGTIKRMELRYAEPRLRNFVSRTKDWLFKHCQDAGYCVPSQPDLVRMADTGAYPGEPTFKVAERNRQFAHDAAGSHRPGRTVGWMQSLLRIIRHWSSKKLNDTDSVG